VITIIDFLWGLSHSGLSLRPKLLSNQRQDRHEIDDYECCY